MLQQMTWGWTCFQHALGGENPAYIVSGLLVGLLVGLTGVGGGSLMTPILVMMFGFQPMTAVGTDLWFAATTKGVGTFWHHLGRGVDWRIVIRLAAGSLPAAALAMALMTHYDHLGRAISSGLRLVLGVALVLSALSLVLKDPIVHWVKRRYPHFGARPPTALTITLGFCLGGLVALSSVGAGALGTISLLLLYPQMPAARLIGSELAHAVPLTLLAGLGHWYLGSVNFSLLSVLLLGSVPGIVVGSQLARRMPERVLRPCLGGVLVLVGVKMLWTS